MQLAPDSNPLLAQHNKTAKIFKPAHLWPILSMKRLLQLIKMPQKFCLAGFSGGNSSLVERDDLSCTSPLCQKEMAPMGTITQLAEHDPPTFSGNTAISQQQQLKQEIIGEECVLVFI
ncbi:hypothetical protein O9992_23025 [Vibrio lentus]|nr:hypothetical protein [Vibrio lentus]